MEPAQALFVGLCSSTAVTLVAKHLESTTEPVSKDPLASCTDPVPTSTLTSSVPSLLEAVPVTIRKQ